MKNTIDRQTAFLIGGLYFIAAIFCQSQGWLIGVWMFIAFLSALIMSLIAHKAGKNWEASFYFSLLFSWLGGVIAFFLSKKVQAAPAADYAKRAVFMDPIEEMEYKERMSKPLPPPAGWNRETVED